MPIYGSGVLRTALAVRRRVDPRLPAATEIRVEAPDISERDNASLAISAQRLVNALAPLYNARLVDSRELLRLVYRFLGETAPEDAPKTDLPINLRGVPKEREQGE